jgi:hypothetical protein
MANYGMIASIDEWGTGVESGYENEYNLRFGVKG